MRRGGGRRVREKGMLTKRKKKIIISIIIIIYNKIKDIQIQFIFLPENTKLHEKAFKIKSIDRNNN